VTCPAPAPLVILNRQAPARPRGDRPDHAV